MPPIDRRALVARHAIRQTATDHLAPLQVGNGHLAFNADITGLQTFFPFNTLTDWAWYESPRPVGSTDGDLPWVPVDVAGRSVPYSIGARVNADMTPNRTASEADQLLNDWLYANPQRINLARIGLILKRPNGTAAVLEDVSKAEQRLDLWTGLLQSRFELDGQPVEVLTCCHPDADVIAFRIRSPLIANRRLGLYLHFPFADSVEYQFHVGAFDRPDEHQTHVEEDGGVLRFRRDLGADQTHHVAVGVNGLNFQQVGPHNFQFMSDSADELKFVVAFSAEPTFAPLPTVESTAEASSRQWEAFWKSGGCVDLGDSSDPRAAELERRIVTSQYATAINCAGSTPAQESGLVSNTWHGKFHLEMYWWHSAHFALWNRWNLWERSFGYLKRILASSQQRAARQGYRGARWPKMTTERGDCSPYPTNAMLIWQQPHPIFFAEMAYRHAPTERTLEYWREIVFETADFMASYAHQDSEGQWNLGPGLAILPENTPPTSNRNPVFELSYWRFGLRVAIEWRKRLGLDVDPHWIDVLAHLAPLPASDGRYITVEGQTDTYTAHNWEHPAVIGAFGMLPGDGVDRGIFSQTLHAVMKHWQFEKGWGWDFPWLAMAAARSSEPTLAVDALMMTGRTGADYKLNGVYTAELHYMNTVIPYLPANGGLLYAVAMMAAGWDGAPENRFPGFPSDNTWVIKFDGLSPAI